MSNPNYCDITVVLDRSGSMESVKADTIGGFDTFVQDQKKQPGKCAFTLVQFDNEYEFVHRAIPMADVPPLVFIPRGGTALLDAIGRTINQLGERLSHMPEPSRPGKIVFVILTDGHENASIEFGQERIAQMIKHQREVYNWEFVFLGATEDAISVAKRMNILLSNSIRYAQNARGVNSAFSSVSSNTTSYRTGASNSMGFSKLDADEQEEALKEGKS